MANIYDADYTADEFHYFSGTRGSDRMVGNGSLAVIVGGGGALDELNPAIPSTNLAIDSRGFFALLYPDGVLPGFGHPLEITYGHGIAQGFGGRNVVHVGDFVWLGWHRDPTEIDLHAHMHKGFGEAVVNADFRGGDFIVADNTRTTDPNHNGFVFDGAKMRASTYVDGNGVHHFQPTQFEVTALSRSDIVVEQNAIVNCGDNTHEAGTRVMDFTYAGSWQSAFRGILESHVGDWFL